MAPTTSSIFSLSRSGNSEDNDGCADGTNHNGFADGRVQRLSGDGDEASQCAVENHGHVDLLVEDLQKDHRCHNAASCCHVGVGEDAGNVGNVGDGAHCELGCTVEAEPAQPQDEGTKGRERHGGSRHRVDGAVSGVFAFTSTQKQCASKSCPAAYGVNECGTGEIGEAHFGQPASTPLPGTGDRVDENRSESQ